MKLLLTEVVSLSFLLGSGCSRAWQPSGAWSTLASNRQVPRSALPGDYLGDGGDPANAPKNEIQSAYTNIGPRSCKKGFDKNDPNETPYLVCSAIAGYALIIRPVDSGRQSVDVLDPAERVLPLKYEEFVTRHMFTLDDKAEWRVVTRQGRKVPIALVVHVRAQEDNENPAKVTNTYIAVAKIAPNDVCVTDVIREDKGSEAEARAAADSALKRQCVQPQPRMTAGGAVIR